MVENSRNLVGARILGSFMYGSIVHIDIEPQRFGAANGVLDAIYFHANRTNILGSGDTPFQDTAVV